MAAAKYNRSSLLARQMRVAINQNLSLDQSSLLAELMEAFGGPKELAKQLRLLYDHTDSPMTKQKIMGMIVGLVVSTTNRELSQEFDPSALSDTELDLMADQYFAKVNKNVGSPEAEVGNRADVAAAGAEGIPAA